MVIQYNRNWLAQLEKLAGLLAFLIKDLKIYYSDHLSIPMAPMLPTFGIIFMMMAKQHNTIAFVSGMA